MAEKQFGVRLSAEGGDKVRAELLGIGQVGQEAFQDVADAANRSRRPIEEVGERAARVGQRAGMGSHGLRQFSLQLNQVAQSGAVTGQWVQSLAVQLPDMLLAFGTAGAVAGTLAALLIPLGTNLAKVAFAAGDVEGALDKAEDSLKAFARAADNSKASWADLVKTYGAAADEVERLHRAQVDAARTTAMQDLLKVGDALGGLADDGRYAGSPGGWTAVRSLQWSYKISKEEAESLVAALRQVDQAGSFEEALPAATTLIERLKDAGITSGDLWDQANRMADTAKGGIAAVNAELGKTIAISREGQAAAAGFLGGLASRATQWLTGKTPGALGQEWGAASKGILDLIGWAEGTDKGRGYNETLGYGAFTGGPVNLTSMTISQVRDLQRQMLAHPANHYNSSAVGRYQIVGTTLERLVRQLGISGDEMFDEKMQDRLAMELVRGRMGGGVEGWYSEWEGLRSKGVGISTITGALGQKSVGVDPAIAKQNEEWQRNLDLRQDWLTGIDAQVKAAALEAQAIGKSTYEIAYQRAEMRLTQELQAKGISLTEKLNGSEKTYGQLVQETAHALAASAQETEVLQGRQTDLITTMEENAQRMRQFREDFVGGFTSAFTGVIDGTKKVSAAFGDMLKSMAARWAEAGLNKLGGWLFDSLFGGIGMGSGDPLSAALIGAGVNLGQTAPLAGAAPAIAPLSNASPIPSAPSFAVEEITRVIESIRAAGEDSVGLLKGAWSGLGKSERDRGWPGLRDGETPTILQRQERVQSRAEAVASGGTSTIKILLSPEIIAEVLDKAKGQSVQVVQDSTPGIVQRAIDTSVRVNSETGMYA